MLTGDFSDAALVLIGHGSTVNADSAVPTYQHAAEIRRRNIFSRVVECFWKIEPKIAGAVAALTEKRVFIVPLFISEGYFTGEAIPRELGLKTGQQHGFARIQTRGQQTIVYCGPIGTHASMADVILARASDVVRRFPFPRAPLPKDTALFIAGHGTEQNENSRKAIEDQAGRIRAKNIFAEVHPVFIEEEPAIETCFDMTTLRNMVVVPFFISDGMHANEDIPMGLGEPERFVRERLEQGQPTWRNPTERRGKMVWYTRSVGTEAQIADVILERVQETLG